MQIYLFLFLNIDFEALGRILVFPFRIKILKIRIFQFCCPLKKFNFFALIVLPKMSYCAIKCLSKLYSELLCFFIFGKPHPPVGQKYSVQQLFFISLWDFLCPSRHIFFFFGNAFFFLSHTSWHLTLGLSRRVNY